MFGLELPTFSQELGKVPVSWEEHGSKKDEQNQCSLSKRAVTVEAVTAPSERQEWGLERLNNKREVTWQTEPLKLGLPNSAAQTTNQQGA